MKWNEQQEDGDFNGYQECPIGVIAHTGPEGWEAWVHLPSETRAGQVEERFVGECYKSAASARRAVENAYSKRMRLREKAMQSQEREAGNVAAAE